MTSHAATDAAPLEVAQSPAADWLWEAVDRLLERGSVEGILFHRLGPLAAQRLRSRGEAPSPALQQEERTAAVSRLAVRPLLERLRASCDGPLVLMKGPELALRYPGWARTFHDLDLLVPDARRVHAQLKEAGFVETGDPRLYHRIHHLRPLCWQTLPIIVEIHSRPKWPAGLSPPSTAQIVTRAVPSALSVDGVLTPPPALHALLVAAHGWAHDPLLRMRDLVDVQALAASADAAVIKRHAREWEMSRLWRITHEAGRALLGQRPEPLACRLWARHLHRMRERTVLENHLQKWLAPLWALPMPRGFAAALTAVLADLTPAPGEEWRGKLARTRRASASATKPLSRHNRELGDEACRGRRFNQPDAEGEP